MPPSIHPLATSVAERVLEGSGISPPDHFLAGLSGILEHRPHDVLFKIVPEPGVGFGKVECLEKECLAKKKVISLSEHSELADGGKLFGIGCLELLHHHQKESPAHKRALKARLGLTPASTSSSQQDVKPSIAKLSSSSASGSAPSKSATASSKMQDSKKRAVVELSDDDDDDLPVFVSATQGKTKTPAGSQQSSSQASLKASSDNKLPFAPSAPNLSQSQPQNSTTRAASHYKPQWEPMRKRTKFTDLQSAGAGDSDVTMQSDRESSAESDLVELSTVFGLAKPTEKGKERERVNSSDVENNSGLAYQPRVRTISGDRINATSAGTKSNPTGKLSAFEQLRALQASKNKPSAAPSGGMDVDVKPASSFTSIRDQAPPTSSSSPGYGAKGQEAGMDSGYLSSIADVSSSSPISKGKERAVDDVSTEYPFFPPYSDVAKSREFSRIERIAVSNIILELKKLKDTAKTCPDFASINTKDASEVEKLATNLTSLANGMSEENRKRFANKNSEFWTIVRTAKFKPSALLATGKTASTSALTSTPAGSASTSSAAVKPELPDAHLMALDMHRANIAAKERSIEDIKKHLTALDRRSLAYQNKLAEQQKLYSEIDGIRNTIKKIKDGQSTPSTAQTAPVDPAEIARQGRIVALTGTIQSLESEMQDAVFNLRRSRGKLQRRKFQMQYDMVQAELRDAKAKLLLAQRQPPVPSATAKPEASASSTSRVQTVDAGAPSKMDLYRTEYSHYLLALANHKETQTTLSKQFEALSKNKIALEKLSKAASANDRRYYSLSIAKVTRDMLEVQLKMTKHASAKPQAPVAPRSDVPPPAANPLSRSNSANGALPFAFTLASRSGGSTANPYGDDAETTAFLAGKGPNPIAWGTSAAAGASSSTAAQKHTANLGPTGLPAYATAPAGASLADLMRARFDSPDSDDYPGTHLTHAYNEQETLKFFQDAATGYDFNEEGEAAMEDALATIGLEKQGDYLKDSQIKLMPHQVLGVAWMLNQEKVRTKLRGGILADEMGLGKTVQTISLIYLHQAKEGDDEKSTLILAPVALLEQWKNEINKFTGNKMSVYIYHGTSKKIGKDELAKYDVVLTTTNTCANEWEECDETARLRAMRRAKKANQPWTNEDEAAWYEKASEQMKPLFTINWRRVVIDEAQNIRNRNTKVSRASLYLNAQYRFALTGTPITNSCSDIYSLLRFLKISPWHDWPRWNSHVGKIEKRRPDLASKRVQAILKLVLLRRNKESTLGGRRLITLPALKVNETPVFLSEDERNVYDYIEGTSQKQLNKYIREGTVMKNYAHIFVLLLRLRQCVGHPALVTAAAWESAHTMAEDPVADRAAAHEAVIQKCGQAKLDDMLKRRYDLSKQRFEDEKGGRDIQIEECPICMDPLDASALLTSCGHAFCTCIKQFMDAPETLAQNPEGFEDHERPCPNCRQRITKDTIFALKYFEPTKKQIAEITGSEVVDDEAEFEKDMTEYLRKKNADLIKKKDGKNKASQDEKGKGRVQASKTTKPRAAKTRAAKRRVVKDSEDEDDFIDDSEATEKVAGYTKKTGGEEDSEAELDEIESEFDDDNGSDESDDGDIKDFLRTSVVAKDVKVKELSDDVRDKFRQKEGPQFIPSAKMEAMLRIIREAPKEDKFMIISQWTSMLDLVAAYLDEQKVRWIQFRGDMKRADRDSAVKSFNESRKVKCLLMSLRAGGVGLNMTGGNRAILLDLAWSPAVEGQAFCRMHRLGQEKEVVVERCVVAGTVEDRILELQAHKQKLADHSLGEGTGEKIKKFGINELKMLFGMTADQGHFANKAGDWVHPDETRKRLPGRQAGPSGPNAPPAPEVEMA